MCEFLKQDGLSITMLETLSYKSRIGLSLKNNVHHFDKETLLQEIEAVLEWYDEREDILSDLPLDYRIKSLQSAMMKYERYYPNRQVRQVYDDLLGFRSIRDSYDDIVIPTGCTALRIADMSKGKAQDDGYRGVHVYYQKDNFHYPIEIQYNTWTDRQLNNWLHKYIYKKDYPRSMGSQIRTMYDRGLIRTEADFKEMMNDVLRRGERCE